MTATSPTAAELIQRHQGLVRTIAATVHRSLSSRVDFDDIVAYGQVGLAEAAREFKPSRGIQFSTYAYHRVRGAMYDGASKLGWYSRAQVRRMRFQQAAEQALRDQREASESKETDPVERACIAVGGLVVVGLALDAGFDEGWANEVEDGSARSGETEAAWADTRSLIHAAVTRLPEDQRQLIQDVYFRGRTLTESAVHAGRDKFWASRTHGKALAALARILRQESES